MIKKLSLFSAAMLIISILANLIFVYKVAEAVVDTCTWDGSSSNAWATAANWSCSTDGEAVPEDGDSLIFPTGASNISMNNDLPATNTYDEIYVTGDSYNFAGNEIEISGLISITGSSNTISGNLEFISAGPSISLNVGALSAGNSMSGGMTLTMGGGADMNFTIGSDFTHTDGIFGSTDVAVKTGVGTWNTSSTAGSTFTASQVSIAGGAWACNIASCLGNAANPITLDDATAHIDLDTAAIIVPNPLTINVHNTSGNIQATNDTFTASPRWNGLITLIATQV